MTLLSRLFHMFWLHWVNSTFYTDWLRHTGLEVKGHFYNNLCTNNIIVNKQRSCVAEHIATLIKQIDNTQMNQ